MADMKIRGVIDTRNYERGVKRMRGQNEKFGKGLSGIGKKIKAAFAVGAILMLIRKIVTATASVIAYSSKINDLSRATGIHIVTLQKWAQTVEDGGGSQQQLVNGLNRIRDAQGQVVDGEQIMIEAINRLGISTKDFISMNTDQAFLAISQALTASGNSADAMNAAGDILGKRVLPSLINGMNAITGATTDYGFEVNRVTEDTGARLDALGNWWSALGKSIAAGWANFFSGILKAFGFFEEETKAAIKQAEELKKKEQEMREAEAKARAEREEAKAEKERLAKLKEIAEKEKEIAEQRNKDMDNIVKSVKLEIDTDSMRKMGGFAGNMVSEGLRYQRQQVQISQKLADYQKSLPKIEENTKAGGLT